MSEAAEAPAAGARAWVRPALVLFGLLGLVYAPMFWGQIVFFRDPAHWNYPARAFVRAALLSGQFPHWNPYAGLGLPVWGNPLYGVFYPPNWTLLLVPEAWVARVLTWHSFAHLLFGGIGLMALARQFGCRRGAALVGALAWSLSGYTTSMWSAGLLLIAGAWVPWIAVGMIGALTSLRRGRLSEGIVKVAAPVALAFLAGEPFIAMMGVGFALLTACAWWFKAGRSSADAARPTLLWRPLALVLGGGLGLAFMIAAIVVLPARAVLAQSPRATGVGAAEAEKYSFHPIRLIEWIAPGSMGHPERAYPGAKLIGEKTIDGLPLAFDVYMGAAALTLALFAFGRGRPRAWWLFGCWVFVLLLAFGRHTPVHGLWRAVALPFAYMRYPEKYVVMMAGWTCLLVAMGAERLLGGERPWKRALGLPLVFAALALLAPLFVEQALAREIRGGALRGGLAAMLALLCLWLVRRKAGLAVPLLATVVAGDLAITVWDLQPFGPADMASREPKAATAIKELQQEKHPVPRLYRSNRVPDTVMPLVPANSIPESERRWVQTLTPNLSVVWGIAMVPGYDAASSQNLSLFWEEGLQFGATLLRLLSIEYALLPVRDPRAPDKRGEAYVPVMDPLPGARLYKVQRPLPRAYVAGAGTVLSDEKTLLLLFTPEVTDGGLAILAEGQGAAPLRAQVGRAGACNYEVYELSHVRVRCEAEREGIVVLVEQHDAGWLTTVDGKPAPLLRVNHAMRGVRVSAGPHVIEMTYHPPLVRPAAALSSLGLLGALALAVQAWRRRRDA